MGDAMGEEKQSNPKYYNYFNALQAFCGGDEVSSGLYASVINQVTL
jgi:hypothetical protein